MKACAKAETVRRLVFTSSAGTIDVAEHQKPFYDETCWSGLAFIQAKKMTGWMYVVSKTMAEQAAWKFAKENNIDFVSIIPPLVVGPFIMQSMPPSLITALSPITGTGFSVIFHKGRYICASHHATILDIAKMLREKYPEYNVPTEFKDVDESLKSVEFSSKKLTDLGFEFKCSLEDVFTGAVETCREKGLLPLSNEKKIDIK
ncbi:hypothetical protein QUC31_000232 [Theobroma cacao]